MRSWQVQGLGFRVLYLLWRVKPKLGPRELFGNWETGHGNPKNISSNELLLENQHGRDLELQVGDSHFDRPTNHPVHTHVHVLSGAEEFKFDL